MLVRGYGGAGTHSGLAAFRFIGCSVPGGPSARPLRSSTQPMTGAEQRLLVGFHPAWSTLRRCGSWRITLAKRVGEGLRPDSRGAGDVVYDGAAALESTTDTDYDVLVLDRDLPAGPYGLQATGPGALAARRCTTGSTGFHGICSLDPVWAELWGWDWVFVAPFLDDIVGCRLDWDCGRHRS